MTFPETTNIPENVLNNNNIAWKNLSIINIIPDTPSPIGGVVSVGNHNNQQKTFDLEFKNDLAQIGKPIYSESEVTIEMDSTLYRAWLRGGSLGHNIRPTRIDNKKIITGDNAMLENLVLDSREIGTMNLTFNFLTKELTDKDRYIYHVLQKDGLTNAVVGGETYQIQKARKDKFLAFAGNDRTIDKHDITTLNAAQINEDAVYKWYDMDENLIFTGTDFTVSPEITTKYKLEIVSKIMMNFR
jgi:hypothetical protein